VLITESGWQCEGYVLCLGKTGLDDHRDRKDDDREVGDDVENPSCEEMGVALSALWPWIWCYLPVV